MTHARGGKMKWSPAKAAVLYNARAGQGRGQAVADRAARFMTQRGWQIVDRRPTPAAASDRRALVCKLAARTEHLVVVGGDGTLREAAAAIHAHALKTTLGFIPIGNANVIARELGIPPEPSQAFHILVADRVLAVDAALITPGGPPGDPVFFLAMLEIGFGAAVIHRVHRWRHRTWRHVYRIWGDLLYVPAALWSLRDPRHPFFRMRIDTRPASLDCRLAVIANTRTYAKGWSFTPRASPTDGMLDVFGRQWVDPAAVIRSYARAWRTRTIQAPDVCYRRGRQLSVSAAQPLCLQADGEPLPPLMRFDVKVLPRAIRILVPRPNTTREPSR